MKKLLLLSAACAAMFSLSACSEESSPSRAEACAELSTDCLKGKWSVASLEGTSISFAGAGTLKFTGSEFSYTPAIADLAHTYCPGTELEGTYDIISPTQIKLIVGFRLTDCFIGDTEIIVNATASENELRLTGIEQSPFVPNDEAAVTEVYSRL